jgi:hypothetical protein
MSVRAGPRLFGLSQGIAHLCDVFSESRIERELATSMFDWLLCKCAGIKKAILIHLVCILGRSILAKLMIFLAAQPPILLRLSAPFAGTALLPKTHYFARAIARGLNFQNVTILRVTSYSGLDHFTDQDVQNQWTHVQHVTSHIES